MVRVTLAPTSRLASRCPLILLTTARASTGRCWQAPSTLVPPPYETDAVSCGALPRNTAQRACHVPLPIPSPVARHRATPSPLTPSPPPLTFLPAAAKRKEAEDRAAKKAAAQKAGRDLLAAKRAEKELAKKRAKKGGGDGAKDEKGSPDEAEELISSVKELLGLGKEPENSHWLKMYRKEGGKPKHMVRPRVMCVWGGGGAAALHASHAPYLSLPRRLADY